MGFWFMPGDRYRVSIGDLKPTQTIRVNVLELTKGGVRFDPIRQEASFISIEAVGKDGTSREWISSGSGAAQPITNPFRNT